MRLVFVFSLVALLGLAASTPSWNLKLLSLNTYPLARCLDGSPGGYYVQRGTSDTWVVHLQGGGWCTSDKDCADRAAGVNPFNQPNSLGGSGKWPATGCEGEDAKTAPVCVADGGDRGMLSNEKHANPDLYAANKVFVGYCDGWSFSGSLLAPVVYNSTTVLYYRGQFILDAVFEELLHVEGMNKAATVILKGCSAGGLATFIHADELVSKVRTVNPTADIVAAPGAGFFLDADPYQGKNTFREAIKWGMERMNSTGNTACAMVNKGQERWKCFVAAEILPFIRTVDLFVMNSLVDEAQSGFIMNLGCDPMLPAGRPSSCSDPQIAYLNKFRDQMIANMSVVLDPKTRHGAFLQTCFVHVVEDVDGSWDGIEVEGFRQFSTFTAWLHARKRGIKVDTVDGPWVRQGDSGNPTCSRYAQID
jgi:hypothetical protein